MGSSISVQRPNPEYEKFRHMIHQTIVPQNILSKGDSAFNSLAIYKYTNDIKHNVRSLRPIRKPGQIYYATRPTFLGKGNATHLIGAIPEKSLKQIPTSFTDEETVKMTVAHNLLLHTLNTCAIILGSETPDENEISQNKMLLQTLNTLYKQNKTTVIQKEKVSVPEISISRIITDIVSNASATIANIEDRTQQIRKENAFIVFTDNRSVIQDLNRHISSYTHQSSSSEPVNTGRSSELNIFKAVLQHVNTLTVCGAKPNTLLGRLSKGSDYPDILTIVASDMATLLEQLLPNKSSTIRTLIHWAKNRLKTVTAYGMHPDGITEGAILKRLFMKQGEALKTATLKACTYLGEISLPSQPQGVVVHTQTQGDTIKRGMPVQNPNKAAEKLYAYIQRENRAMGNAAIKVFETLFEILPSPNPGSINLPITINTPEQKEVYATIRSNVLQSKDPLTMLAESAAILVYTIAVAYDNLWTILSKENMKKVYGLRD
jgi:translation initiation factor 2 beta subunit (eIF-2beta)/eIF-5